MNLGPRNVPSMHQSLNECYVFLCLPFGAIHLTRSMIVLCFDTYVSWPLQIGQQDQFVVLACDGIFDVLSSDEVVADVWEKMKQHRDAQRCGPGS